MNKQEQSGFRWNTSRGMVAGIFVGATVALAVSAITDNQSIWAWAIPVGLAVGLAFGPGRQRNSEEV